MKKFICPTIIASLLLILTSCQFQPKNQDDLIYDSIHNSRNSLDWWGVYTGLLPCADCEGIKVILTLNRDETYELSYLYVGKSDTPFVFSGEFVWDEAGGRITLPREDFPIRYKVGEGRLYQLDVEGNPVSGDLAEMYVLIKTAN